MSEKTAAPPPAYFLSLSLENVRSFGEKQTISFARPDGRPAQWTIILGDNGVGKTTVLKALASTVYENGNFIHDSSARLPYLWRNAMHLWFPFRGNGKKNLILYSEVSTGASWAEDKNENFLRVKTRIELAAELAEPENNLNKGAMASTSGGNPEQLKCYGYGAGRTVGNLTLGENPEITNTCASLFDDRADLLNPEEWFLQMEYSSLKQDKQAGKALEQVRQVLLQVLPDVTDIRIASKKHQQYLELETPYGWVRLRDMSLGYQTLVVWLTDFASKLFIRYPDSPNPLEEPAIVLIDEIDLHLHPSWQRKLLGFLSGIFKNTQFIATAHSPLVVQAAGDQGANVVLLRREGDQTIVHQNPEDVRGWRLDQILTSELFGLETARSLQTEAKLERRAELLTKTKRTASETKELKKLTEELNAEPLGETPSERDVNAVLQELRQRLQPKDSDAAAV